MAIGVVATALAGQAGPLRWDAPPQCPGAAEVHARIDALLGWPWEGGPTSAEATVSQQPDGWRLHLALRSGELVDERVLDAATCQELSHAAAIIVASAVRREGPAAAYADAQAATDPTPVAPVVADPAVKADPAAEPDPAPLPPARRTKPRSRPILDGILRLEGGADFGTVAAAAGGVRLAAGVGFRYARVEVLGTYWLPRRHAVSKAAGAVVSAGVVELRGCGRVRLRRVEFPVCLGAEAGTHRSRGYGFKASSLTHAPWLAFAFTSAIAWRVHSRVALFVGPQVWVAAVRPRIVTEVPGGGQDTIYRVPVFGGRATAGLEFRLQP